MSAKVHIPIYMLATTSSTDARKGGRQVVKEKRKYTSECDVSNVPAAVLVGDKASGS